MSEKWRGYLVANDKGDNESRPDWKGKLTIDGVGYQLAAWAKETKDGDPMLSISAEKRE